MLRVTCATCSSVTPFHSLSQPSAWDASKKLRANLCGTSPLPSQAKFGLIFHCSYAILLGPSASVEELGRQASTVASAAVAACDTDASGARTPSLASIEGATPAQRAGWVMSLCGATQAKDALQQLPAGLVLPALALRCTFQLLSKGNVVMFFWYAGT